MNTQLLQAKMQTFFAEISPEYLVREFEKMGYTFIDSDIDWNPPKTYVLCRRDFESIEVGFFNRLFGNSKRKNIAKKLTSDYLGSFFYLKIAV